jgi:hypothetical protein
MLCQPSRMDQNIRCAVDAFWRPPQRRLNQHGHLLAHQVEGLSDRVHRSNLVGMGADPHGVRRHFFDPLVLELLCSLGDEIQELVSRTVGVESVLVPVIPEPHEHGVLEDDWLDATRGHPVWRHLLVPSNGGADPSFVQCHALHHSSLHPQHSPPCSQKVQRCCTGRRETSTGDARCRAPCQTYAARCNLARSSESRAFSTSLVARRTLSATKIRPGESGDDQASQCFCNKLRTSMG